MAEKVKKEKPTQKELAVDEKDKTKKERQAEYMKAWRAAHPEYKKRQAEYNKTYRKANRERRNEYSRAWRASHKEHVEEYQKANKECKAKHDKAWYEANKEYKVEYQKNYLLSLAEKHPDGYISDESRTGENSPNWKGCPGRYPRCAEFKVNRLVVLNEADWVCYECGRDADRAHHIDFSKDNHAINNLLPVCRSCHKKLHRNKERLEEVYA